MAVTAPLHAHPMLLSPSRHHRYKSTVSAISDSYSRTAAAQQRRALIVRQHAEHAARLAHAQQEADQRALNRQFLFRELTLSCINRSKHRRIDLERRAGLRTGSRRRRDEPWFDTIPVLVEQWHCTGAKARLIEAEGWKDPVKVRASEQRTRLLEERDRLAEAQCIAAMREQRRAHILGGFLAQQARNACEERRVRDMFANRPASPLHLQPPASYVEATRGRRPPPPAHFRSTASTHSACGGTSERRECEENDGSGDQPGAHRSFPPTPSRPTDEQRRSGVRLPQLVRSQSRVMIEQRQAFADSRRAEEARAEDRARTDEDDRSESASSGTDDGVILPNGEWQAWLGPVSPLHSDWREPSPPPLVKSDGVACALSAFEQRMQHAAPPVMPLYLTSDAWKAR